MNSRMAATFSSIGASSGNSRVKRVGFDILDFVPRIYHILTALAGTLITSKSVREHLVGVALILVLLHILVMVDAVYHNQNFTVDGADRAVRVGVFLAKTDMYRDFLFEVFIPAPVGVTVFGEVVLAILTECAGTGQCYIVLFWLSFSVLSRSLAGRRTPKKAGATMYPG